MRSKNNIRRSCYKVSAGAKDGIRLFDERNGLLACLLMVAFQDSVLHWTDNRTKLVSL